MPHLSLCDCGASRHFLVTASSTAGPPVLDVSLEACSAPSPGVRYAALVYGKRLQARAKKANAASGRCGVPPQETFPSQNGYRRWAHACARPPSPASSAARGFLQQE